VEGTRSLTSKTSWFPGKLEGKELRELTFQQDCYYLEEGQEGRNQFPKLEDLGRKKIRAIFTLG